MTKRYYIVDQNYLRKAELKTLADTDRHVRFVLPDAALIEMCKSSRWEETLRRSLRILSGHPQRTRISLSVGEAIGAEIEYKKSIEGRLLPRDFVPVFNELLSAVASGATNQVISKLGQRIESIQADLGRAELNHEQNRNGFAKLINVTRDTIEPETRKALRNGTLPREERLSLIHEAAPHLLEDFFKQAGFSVAKAKTFIKTKPMVLRYIYLKLWACLDWLANGGFEGLPPKRVTNEIMDHEYILMATFFDGILSNESRVNEAYLDICQLLRL